MKSHTSKYAGFTLLEVLMAVSIISVVSVASIYMLFLSLNLRDLSLSTAKTEESLRVFDRSLREAVIGAQSINGNNTSLFLRSTAECWSFVYDNNLKNIKYTKISQVDCIPDPNPSALFFPNSTKINSFSFFLSNLSTGGRQVSVNAIIQTTLPLDSYLTNFSASYSNLID